MAQDQIILVDDHAMFRAGLTALLRLSIADLEVLEASTISEAMQMTAPAPKAVLLDNFLRGLNGLEGIEIFKRKWPLASVIMVSSDTEPNTAGLALARGADEFVSKEKSADNIVSAVLRALGHASASGVSTNSVDARTEGASRLTPRQLEVLDLMCQGLPNKSIGRRLNVSENTVRWHVQAILAFLQVSNRSEASFAARRMGLIS